MADLQVQFELAQVNVQKLKKRPSNEDMLVLYALFKQGSMGNARGRRPGMLDMKGRAKFDAWVRVGGASQEAAMKRYVSKVKELQGADS